jgi:hypothetical protein
MYMVPYTKRIVNVDSSIFVAVPVELSSQRGEFLSIWNISCARNIIATTYKAVFRFHYTAILKKARRERNALNISLHALLNSTVKVDSSGFWVHSVSYRLTFSKLSSTEYDTFMYIQGRKSQRCIIVNCQHTVDPSLI